MNLKLATTRAIAGTKLSLNKNAPTIMTVAGVAGFTATTVLAIQATLKFANDLPQMKEDIQHAKDVPVTEEMTEHDRMQNLVRVYGDVGGALLKIYGPTLATGAVSVALVLSAHGMMRHRQASLVAAYAALDAGYRAYRKRVEEHLGTEEEEWLYRGVKTARLTKGDGDEELPGGIADPQDRSPSPYARFFDEYNPNWSKTPEYNMMFLQAQQQWANDRLIAHGYVFLNEVLEALGFERTQAGQIVGWKIKGSGDGYIDFGIHNIADENSRAFVNGIEPVVLLDFNVDGVIGI